MQIIKKYNYAELKREDGYSRLYLTPDGDALPSVTTILSKTKDKTFLKQWRAKVGEANAEKIIRIETLDSVRIGREVEGQMSGDAVAKFDWTAMGSRVWSKAEIRAWLASFGIVPVGPKTYKANPALKKTRGRRMPTFTDTRNPKKKPPRNLNE